MCIRDSLKGQDTYKIICIALIVVGVLAATAGVLLTGKPFDWINQLVRVRGSGS